MLGDPGPPLPGALDLRGRTTLAEAATVLQAARAFLGIDSGLMWMAASLQVPAVGLYGAAYIPRCAAVQPENPHATYLEAENDLASLTPERVLAACRDRPHRLVTTRTPP